MQVPPATAKLVASPSVAAMTPLGRSPPLRTVQVSGAATTPRVTIPKSWLVGSSESSAGRLGASGVAASGAGAAASGRPASEPPLASCAFGASALDPPPSGDTPASSDRLPMSWQILALGSHE